jgi:hypothetical protein
MKTYIILGVFAVNLLLPSSSVLGFEDPPAKSSSSTPGDKSSPAKKETDGGLGDLFNGLAGQTLKVFFNPELLKEIPGDSPAEKSENAKVLLGMIEGDTVQDKLEVIKALKKLKSDPSIPRPPEEVKRKVKDLYPILEQFAGADGYVNHADVSPIMESVYDGTIRRLVRDALPRIAARREAIGKRPILADQEPKLREEGEVKLHKFLDKLGVPEETGEADASPKKREIWPRVFEQITENGVISIPKAQDFYRTLSMLPPPPDLKDKIIFKNGLPVRKMKPLVSEGKIPKDLRISLDKKTGKLVIQ